ncbi:MAG: hypothetical protein LQ350_006077 [Teloschistes chrysophthalmus]|nr:MAG: hypothetical protein LQ350_006077 [Niorma chrysophthalma]
MQSSSPDDPVESHDRTSAPAPPTKVDQISKVCGEVRDLEALVQLATSRDGLVNDQVRQRAWPLLLGYQPSKDPEIARDATWKNLPLHKDEDQVARDVDRSFIYYPKNQSESQLDRRKADLSTVITQVLRTYPMLSYFQGFHDIVQVFLLVLGADDAPDAVSHLALSRIRDFMLPSLSPSLAHLRLLPAILQAEDARLCQHLSQTQPFFALASTLTLYAHDIEDYSDIARLFDFLLAQDAIVSVYFFAEIILSRREELFEISSDDSDMLHFVLSKLPKPLDLETLITQTMSLYTDHPPETLPYRAWARISPYSVLKTARADFRQQPLSDGVELFQRQEIQLRNNEMLEQAKAMLWKYRGPAGQVGLAIFVGVLAIWLRKKWL